MYYQHAVKLMPYYATWLAIKRVTTFWEFLETWKCQQIRLRSAKSQEKVKEFV